MLLTQKLSEIGCDKDPLLVSQRVKRKNCDFKGVTFSSLKKQERCPIDLRSSCIFQVEANNGLGKTPVNPFAVCSAVKFKKTGKPLAPGPVAARWTAKVLDTYTKKQLKGWILYTQSKDPSINALIEDVYALRDFTPSDLVKYWVTSTLDLLTKPELIRVILLYNWGRKPKINIPIRCVRAR